MSAAAGALQLPRAIVIVSAHWDTRLPTVGFAERPRTIHDYVLAMDAYSFFPQPGGQA
jgi:4,5-DOPA dioxygenase extradiol